MNEYAEKMYLEDRLLFNVLSVTNAENLVLAEKLVFQSKMDINNIIIFLEKLIIVIYIFIIL